MVTYTTKLSVMKCYITALRCFRSKCFLWLSIVIFIIVLARLFQHRRKFFLRSMFRRNFKGEDSNFLFYGSLANNTHFVPGSFLEGKKPKNVSYCQFRNLNPDFIVISDSIIDYSPELGDKGLYRVIYNVIEGLTFTNASHNNKIVTFCTHVTPEFMYYIAEILHRWEGLVSVSAFVPGTDASLLLCILRRLCSCLPEMSRVSLHFIFPTNFPPHHAECQQSLTSPNDCSVPIALSNKEITTFRRKKQLTYPVNVARNVARSQANTVFVLVSDVELFPSRKLVSNFLAMLERLQMKRRSDFHSFFNLVVYALPVFEVEPHAEIPTVKSQLLELYSENRAVYFHRWVCLHCQRFPGLQRWLQRDVFALDNMVQPFLIVRREYPYHRWEPVYIGTNQEPFYSEQLSWEGQQDKMTQMHEMCLMGYRFVILDGAFLVHAPGIKRRSDVEHSSWLTEHRKENMRHYDAIIADKASRHHDRPACKVH